MRIITNDLTHLIDKGDPLSLICVDVEQQKLFSAENLKMFCLEVLGFLGMQLVLAGGPMSSWSSNKSFVFK